MIPESSQSGPDGVAARRCDSCGEEERIPGDGIIHQPGCTPTAAHRRGYGYVARWTTSGRPMIRMVEDEGPNCANVKLCRTMLGARFGAWWRNRRIGV